MKIERSEAMRAEQSPYQYDGETCDQQRAQNLPGASAAAMARGQRRRLQSSGLAPAAACRESGGSVNLHDLAVIDRSSLQLLPEARPRVETGPVQFGTDQPGVFIRGDDAEVYRDRLVTLEAVAPMSVVDRALLRELWVLLGPCEAKR